MFHVKHLPPAAPARPVVRVVLPSGAIRAHDRESFEAGLVTLAGAGFEVRFDPARRDALWRDYYAGPDATRAAEFVAALDEPGVDIIWWGRGGGGSARLTAAICTAARRRAPRIIIGFSDATALLNALAARCGWITFHGPAVTSLGRADLDHLRAVVRGERHDTPFEGDGPRLRGRLFGGNLTVLTAALGTSAAPPVEGTIWLLEEVNEAPYRVDRCLHQLKRATGGPRKAKPAVGAWLGPLFGEASAPDRVVEELGLPCATGAPIGHSGPMRLVPIGAPVVVDPASGRLTGAGPWVAHA